VAARQRQERGFVSRSTVATKDAWDFSKAWFQVELPRVTDPRSDELARPAKALTDSSKAEHRYQEYGRISDFTSWVNSSVVLLSVSICVHPWFSFFNSRN
jgi:hypothetical protein